MLRTERLRRLQILPDGSEDRQPKVESVVAKLRADHLQDIELRQQAEATAAAAEVKLAATQVQLLTLQQEGQGKLDNLMVEFKAAHEDHVENLQQQARQRAATAESAAAKLTNELRHRSAQNIELEEQVASARADHESSLQQQQRLAARELRARDKQLAMQQALLQAAAAQLSPGKPLEEALAALQHLPSPPPGVFGEVCCQNPDCDTEGGHRYTPTSAEQQFCPRCVDSGELGHYQSSSDDESEESSDESDDDQPAPCKPAPEPEPEPELEQEDHAYGHRHLR